MNRMFHIVLFLIFIISGFFQPFAFSQFSYSVHYDEKDKLASSKVYDMLQDTRGLMWFATEDGVSSFDGNSFTNYTHRNGLASNSTIKLYEDLNGRIWFLSYTGEISYLENNSIYQHWINPEVKNKSLRMFDHINVDSIGNMFLSGAFGGWMYCREKEKTFSSFINNDKKREIFNYTVFFSLDPKKDIVGFFYDDTIGIQKLEDTYPELQKITLNNQKFYSYFHKHKLDLGNNAQLITLGPLLVYWDVDTTFIVKEFAGNIIALSKDMAGNIWLSEQFAATYFYKNGDLNSIPKTYFQNLSISGILEDHEGNYWFTSTEKGVFMIPGFQFKTFFKAELGTPHEMILSLETDGDRLLFSTGNQGVFAAKTKQGNVIIDKSFQPTGTKTSNVKDILALPDGTVWLTGGEFIRFDKDGNDLAVHSDNKYSGYSLNLLWGSHIALTSRTGYTLFDLEGNQISNSENQFNIQTFDVCQQNDSSLLLGTIDGLYQFKNNSYQKITKPEAITHRITTIEKVGANSWVGTFDYGLVVICPDTFYTITEKDGLPGDRIKTIFAENENLIWVGGSKGLSKIKWNQEGGHSYDIINFGVWDGLPSNEINDILFFKGLMWLATSNGLVSFDADELEINQRIPDIIMEDISINDKKIQTSNDLNLSYKENNITFNFRARTFKNCNQIRYKYRLDGLEEKWIESSNHNIRYSGLKSGSYKFIVQALYYNGTISDPIIYSFRINKHFADTILFRASILIIIILLSAFLVMNYNKNQNQKRKLERQILLAEQNAVRSQMNPHFIFNSLNSIQNFILDNDDKNANLYLVIFSSLIRKILEASKQNFISLREEIETIKLYVELEKFRFENQFEFNINIDNKVNADQLAIPSMIIQPFLENAIWHGLVPKKGKGLLELGVTENSNGLLLISITDNGIGREKAAVISKRRKHHKPTGMKNVEERLNLLNKMNDTHMAVEIIDLFDKDSLPCGTRVEFLIDI